MVLRVSEKDRSMTLQRDNGCRIQANSDFLLIEIINWVRMVAENPGDRSIGNLFSADQPKHNFYTIGELFSLALMARRALFKKPVNNDDGDPEGTQLKKKQKMDNNNMIEMQRKKKIRCSKNIHSVEGHHHSCCCYETTSVANKDRHRMPAAVSQAKLRLRSSSVSLDGIAAGLPGGQVRERIPVGPSFQAELPEWTEKASTRSIDPDDSKWLGTQTWSPEEWLNKTLNRWDAVGKGRKESCGCEHQGSVECVGFHLAETRHQLKCELGSAFLDWRFDFMGEEVAKLWPEYKEEAFKYAVRNNVQHSLRSFPYSHYQYFPSQGRQGILSYYYNVFILRCRRYQNRSTPEDIDSDDENNAIFKI